MVDDQLTYFTLVKNLLPFVRNGREAICKMRYQDRAGDVTQGTVGIVKGVVAIFTATVNYVARISEEVVTGRSEWKSIACRADSRLKQIMPGQPAVVD